MREKNLDEGQMERVCQIFIHVFVLRTCSFHGNIFKVVDKAELNEWWLEPFIIKSSIILQPQDSWCHI